MTTNNLMMLRRGGKNVTKTVMAKGNKFVQQKKKNILFGNSEKTVVRVIVAHIIHALK